MTKSPVVSVVIPTRNRPEFLNRLLGCVKAQDFQDFECIVVDDGSSDETVAVYSEIWRGLDERFHLHLKSPEDKQRGGPSRTRNRAIMLARGEYVAFCDDDDQWLRADHLGTGMRVMQAYGADLYFAGLQLSQDGNVVRPDFYAAAANALTRHKLPGESDIFEIQEQSRVALLRHHVLHCNTTIAARQLIIDSGLYWENLYVRVDRDFGLRLIDRANRILYRSTVSADYDVTVHSSVSQSYSLKESALFNTVATLHAELTMRNPALRRVARGNRAWYLTELAHAALVEGDFSRAREFSLQSLLLRPTRAALRLYVKARVKLQTG